MRIIAGDYKRRVLKTTTGPGFRPAMGIVREALFSMLEARGVVWQTTRGLDLFAGSGSLGFEALSRGATHMAFVENGVKPAAIIRENAVLLGIEDARFTLHQNEVGKVLGKRPALPVSLVFIDPPYRMDVLARTLRALLKNGWVEDGAIINAEIEARTPFSPEKAHENLIPLDDRAYGQTRVLLWQVKK